MQTLKTAATSLAAAALLALVPFGGAVAEELAAAAILSKSQGNRQIENSIQTLEMVLYNKAGQSRSRTITSKIKQTADGARSHVKFEQPEDVAGVQFLSIQHAEGEDDQWLYMPAGDLLNRISGSSRTGSFMGSDFSFEDLSIGDAEDGTHIDQGTETIEVAGQTLTAHKIETTPKPELKSAYSKLVTWIDTTDYMPRQVLFFDKKGVEFKRMQITQVKKDGEEMVPLVTVMENLKRGTKTEIKIIEYRTNVPAEELPDSMFTQEYLKSEG